MMLKWSKKTIKYYIALNAKHLPKNHLFFTKLLNLWLKKIHTCKNSSEILSTAKVSKHTVFSYSECIYDNRKNEHDLF